jgi:RNA polymerase sigma-70 factor (ECF subfamily)
MITDTATLPNAVAQCPSLRHGTPSAIKETSDANLIRALSAGEESAMGILFARHNVRVYRYVLRFVGDESLAEDVVSDVFIEAWRSAARYEGRSQVLTWLFGIARFKALSAVRRRKHEELDEAQANAIPDTADNPEIAAHMTSRLDVLRKCMSNLSPGHREIIDLIYFREKLIDEAAEILGVPENTIKTRVFHARKRMSELLRRVSVDQTSL